MANLGGHAYLDPIAFGSAQSVSFLINVLRIVSSFRIAATNANFFGFPFANRRT